MKIDADKEMNQDFAYPFKFNTLEEESLRTAFSQFRLKNELYASLKVNLVTAYGLNQNLGTAHITQQSKNVKEGTLVKFYISKTYRKTGFEDKALIEVLNFAFNTMEL